MRTSRISRETSKLVSSTTSLDSSGRKTRSSLSRFAHNGVPLVKEEINENENENVFTTDIEDIIPTPRKRKRKHSVSDDLSKPIASRNGIKIKTEVEDRVAVINPPPLERRVRKPARQIKNEDTGEVEIHPPNDWGKVYTLVKEMRIKGAARNAAVDTMGCESLAADDVSPRDKRYHTLTALMLSSQTKDTTNAIAMKRLQTELPSHTPGGPPGLNIENILAVEPEVLNKLIWVVGFHNNKTKYIKAAAIILRDNFDSDIPDTIEGLMSLPGVGPKMAYLCMSTAWGRTEGIGVDVHVHRITNLWGWHGGGGTKGPEETRIALQKWLPRELWHEINWLLVGLGQTVCLPVGRKCGECEVGLQGFCKSADRGKVSAGRKLKNEVIENDEKEDVLGKEDILKEEAFIDDKSTGITEGTDIKGRSQKKPP